MKASIPFVLLLTLQVVGCRSSSPAATDLPIKTTGDATLALEISAPKVEVEGTRMILSGTVRRKSGFDDPTPGHLHAYIISKEGVQLYELAIRWDPADIPLTDGRSSPYRIQFGWIPPKESTIEVLYSTDSHELLEGSSSGGGNASGALKGTPQGIRQQSGPKQPSTPRQPGRGVQGR